MIFLYLLGLLKCSLIQLLLVSGGNSINIGGEVARGGRGARETFQEKVKTCVQKVDIFPLYDEIVKCCVILTFL